MTMSTAQQQTLEKVLSRGFSVDALTMFRDFYGKAPDIGPLLEARGLIAAGE